MFSTSVLGWGGGVERKDIVFILDIKVFNKKWEQTEKP